MKDTQIMEALQSVRTQLEALEKMVNTPLTPEEKATEEVRTIAELAAEKTIQRLHSVENARQTKESKSRRFICMFKPSVFAVAESLASAHDTSVSDIVEKAVLLMAEADGRVTSDDNADA